MRRLTLTVMTAVMWLIAIFPAEAGKFAAARASIQDEDLRKHVNVLASDTFEGREAGSRGGKAAGVYLVEQLKKTGVQPAGLRGGFFQEFGADFRNILVVLPGADPKLKREYILVGAHYDHVGYGTRRNSRGPIGYIHNGADDNGSGTAGLLELVQAFSSLEPQPKRSILFVFWDAEEKGLLGSEHWVSAPTVPLKQVRLVVNMDMIGRLRENTLTVFGVRTTQGLRRLISEQNQEPGLDFDFRWDIVRDSDHYPFVTRGIPYVMPFTRKHYDYHRPSDDIEKLNWTGMRQVTQLVFGMVHEAANRPSLPAFRQQSRNEDKASQESFLSPLPALPPRLGVAWDHELDKKRNVTLTHVTPGSAADRGGLREGDRILEFGNYRIADVPDFRTAVQAARNPVRVLVERRGQKEPLTLSLQLIGKPVRLGIAWRRDAAAPNAVVLARIQPGSAADLAGLKVADRVYAVSGRGFRTNAEFQKLIHDPADPLTLLVERRGRIRTVRLKFLTETIRPADSTPTAPDAAKAP